MLKTVLRKPFGQDPGVTGAPFAVDPPAEAVALGEEDPEVVAVVFATEAPWVKRKGPL